MFRIFYSEKDATLYESNSTANTGLDEVLEIGKNLDTAGENWLKSRSLLKFDMSEVTDVLSKYSVSLDSCKFVLQLFTTHAKNLPATFTIDCKLAGQPWQNGTGFASSNPIVTNGVSWAEPYESWSLNSQTGSLWISGSQLIQVNSSSIYVTGSGDGGSWLYQSGSSIFDISNFNQSFFPQAGLSTSDISKHNPTDINIDVTDAVKIWISGSAGASIPNNGFLLKYSDADEANSNVTGYVRYFSRDTHTIYVPKLTMYWDNSTYTTGSLTAVDTESFIIYTALKPEYKDTEITKIRMYARDKYPRKSPTNTFPNQTVNYLPVSTYYAIYDAATDESIIPYDDIYTKVSCDTTSNFIYLDMNGFMPERRYRIELKIVDGFTEQIVNDKLYFKVVR
jgi:hypothetical protein